MIQNGHIDTEAHNRAANHQKNKKMFHGISSSPYFNDIRKQTIEPIRNDVTLSSDVSTTLQNGVSGDNNGINCGQQQGWNQIRPIDNSTDLSYEHMWELRQILDKRVKNKLSAGMSPEGRKAMELARAEVEHSKRKEKKGKKSNRESDFNKLPEIDLPNSKKRTKVKKKISFVDAYESSSASRLSGDVMDESSSDGNPRRWALGGGNINVAMETVEIVSYGDTESDSDADDLAIEATAKLNSVEKCMVWMGVHTEDDFEEQR